MGRLTQPPRPAQGRRATWWDGPALWHAPAVAARAGFDVASAARTVPLPADPTVMRRAARAVRQDVWRALRHVRGGMPVVRVAPGLVVSAGLVAPHPLSQKDAQRLEAALHGDWAAWAAQGAKQGEECSVSF